MNKRISANKKLIDKLISTILILIIVIGLSWHFQAVWYQNLFGDEIHSLFFTKNNSVDYLLKTSVEPIHPNGIYVLLKVLYEIMPSVLFLRIGMLVIFLLSCVVLWLILSEFFKEKIIKLMGLSLWVSSAYIWHFSFQLRMYGPAFLLVLLSILILLKKKVLISLIIDWLLLSFVYGGILFVVAKWVSYLLTSFLKAKSKKEIQRIVFYCMGAFLPIGFILINFLSKQDTVSANYLYWVKVPVWPDWSLTLTSFLTGLFLPYFEGYALLSNYWLKLGGLLNFIMIGILILGLVYGWRVKKKLWSWFKNMFFEEQFLLVLNFLIVVLYTTVFLFSLVFNNHVFHIRQLFSVAIVFWLILIWIVGKLWKNKPIISCCLVLIVLLINLFGIFKDSSQGNQAYVHHFEVLPGKPVIASHGDIELIYKQCETFDRDKIVSKCKERDIYFLESKELEEMSENIWWQTTSITKVENSSSFTCKNISVDFYKCEKIK